MAADSLSQQVGHLLKERHWKLATAESCTGGLVGHLITNVPGSSEYYLGGIVSYANQVKMELLGVRVSTLDRHGAVSEATALEMAHGVRTALKADIGLSVTGIAGPAGGTAGKPVGLTWVGISTPDGSWARRFMWNKDREGNKGDSAQAALKMLLNYLQGGFNG